MTTVVKRSPEEIGSQKVVLRCGTCRKALAEARINDGATVLIKSTLSLFETSNFVVIDGGFRLFRCSSQSCGDAGLVSDKELENLVVAAAAEGRQSAILSLRSPR
jgi:hypothetical protein